MTLVVTWVRRTAGAEELIVASDSRLTGGIALNHAPKLFSLERKDAVLAYCGPTVVAYPILLQVKANLDAHDETRDRAIDIVDLKSHIEKSIERLRTQICDLPSGDHTNRSFKFLLAGYSWKCSRFVAWTFRYDIETGEFNAHALIGKNRSWGFMSDVFENELNAGRQLMRAIYCNPKNPLTKLDWEPLKVLFSFIRDPEYRDIGGPPQIMKVYRHANTIPINVLWPEDRFDRGVSVRTHEIYHLGRPLLGYERTRFLTLDPQSEDFIEPWKIRNHVHACNEYEDEKLRDLLRVRIALLIDWKRKCLLLQEKLSRMLREGASFETIKAIL